MPNSAPAYSVILSAAVVPTSTIAAGQPLVYTGTAYVISTAANRVLYGRTAGMALDNYGGTSATGYIRIQQVGAVDSTIVNLGAGAPDRWVRASATGSFEVFTPVNAGTSDIVGKADANGAVTLEPGIWTETMAAGGGASFTPPTGTGFATTTAGALDAASLPFPLSVAKGGTGQTTVPGVDSQMIYRSAGALMGTSFTTDGSGISFGPGYTAYGTTPAASGRQRYPWNAGVATPLMVVKDSGGNDITIVNFGAGAAVTFGSYANFDVTLAGAGGSLNMSSSLAAYIAGVQALDILAAKVGLCKPISGSSANSYMYAEKETTVTISSAADRTLVASEYENPVQNYTGTPGGAFNVIAPAQAAAKVTVYNGTPSALTYKKSGGTGVIIATLKTAVLRFSSVANDWVRVTGDA